ncbi:MAG TPA: hypothetical protein VHQ90_00780 [Thermoanaerobaculia bacterium]|nr:hypothetical protein [Thermoanaerobaculia bacterium]
MKPQSARSSARRRRRLSCRAPLASLLRRHPGGGCLAERLTARPRCAPLLELLVRRPCRTPLIAAAAASSRRRRRAPLSGALVVLLVLLAGPWGGPAAAQIPVTDVAHIAVNSYWHALHYAQLAFQLYQQYQQIVIQIRQIDAQLRALRKLANPNWREIAGLLTELDALMRSGRSLGYALVDAGAQFRHVYPGWTRWHDPIEPTLQAESALDTFRAGLAALSRQTRTLAAGEQTLAAMRRQMAATDGHQQALEHLATLAAFSAQEQLLSRQSLAVAANFAAVAHGYSINRQAQADATFRGVVYETSLARGTSAGFTFQPPWVLP